MSVNPEILKKMSDSELEAELMSKQLSDHGLNLVIQEVNQRYLKKSIEKNFVPKWAGWLTLAVAILAALASIAALLK